MSRPKSREVERLRKAATTARTEAKLESAMRERAEALVHQQRLILEGLTEQVACATCAFAFSVGLMNPDAVVPEYEAPPK